MKKLKGYFVSVEDTGLEEALAEATKGEKVI